MSESESNNVTLEFCDGESVEINLNVDGVEEAPVNNTLYGRRNKEWVSVTTGGGIPDAPVDGLPYVRKDANWEEGYTKADADAAFEPAGTTATHEARQDNPHNVTALQAGADPVGSAAGVQANLDTHTGDADIHFSDAPNDANSYVRSGLGWSQSYTKVEIDAELSDKADQADLDTHTGDSDIHFSDAPSDGQQYARKDAGWEVVVGGGGGIPEAPNDSNSYVRAGLGWVVGYSKADADAAFDPAGSAAGVQANLDTHTGDSDIHFPDALSDGKQYARKNGTWEEVEAGSGGGVMFFDLLSAGWVADGDEFYQDISHNLGTNDFLIEFEDAADNSIVIPNNVTKTDTNTVRVSVYGNTWNLRVLISTAPTPSNTGNGFIDYNNTDNPILITGGVWTDIPNDGLGPFTNNTYAPVGVSDLVDVSTGYFDFTELDLGDQVFIRNDYTVTPTVNNTKLELRYVLGSGPAEYVLEKFVMRMDDGSGIPYRQSLGVDMIYMGDLNTRDNPVRLQLKASSDCSVSNAGSVATVVKR